MKRTTSTNKRVQAMRNAWAMFKHSSKPFGVCITEAFRKINKQSRVIEETEDLDFAMF